MDSETIISILFGAILALFSIATVGYSFVNNRRPLPKENSAYSDDNDQDLADIFDAISTLDLEFQLGRLPQEQFQEQFQAYRLQAATVLRDKLDGAGQLFTFIDRSDYYNLTFYLDYGRVTSGLIDGQQQFIG